MLLTTPRQVRVVKCAILSPGLHLRATDSRDIETLRNYGFDILPFVQKIDLYESMFDNTISGTLTVLENVGLTEYLPLVGVETLALVFEIDVDDQHTKRFARTFRITGLKDQAFPRHDYRLYTLQFVTQEFVTSVSSRICKRYRSACEEAVRDILRNDLDVAPERILTNEPSFGKVDVLIPNYTPLQAINYFATLALTQKSPREANFLFFETLDGFHFTSIRSIIANTLDSQIPTFNVDPSVTVTPVINADEQQNSITRVHQEQAFDMLTDIASGALRSKMLHFDLLAQQINYTEDSRYSKTFKETTHLDKYPVYPNNIETSVSENVRIFMVPSNAWTANSSYIQSVGEIITEQRMHEAIVLRNRQLREIRHVQTLIDLPGSPDLRAGSIVNINYPSTRTLSDAESNITQPVAPDNHYYNGKHLVVSVHHILRVKSPGSMEYRMNLRVNRDSLGAPLIGGKDE